tara:strand:+ start:232 stop:783 length:552 start_codon:yes stop_codon:yes gene_type:complete
VSRQVLYPPKEGFGMSKPGHNSGPDRGLFFSHLSAVQKATNRKDDASAEVSRAKRLAKADGIYTDDLTTVLDWMKTEDRQIVVDRLERMYRYAQWLNIIPEDQGDLFADRRPKAEANFAEGLADGLRGVTLDEARGKDYERGWQEGQKELLAGIKKMGTANTEELQEEAKTSSEQDAAAKAAE